MLRILLGMSLLIISNAALGEPVIQSSNVEKFQSQNLLADITSLLFKFQKLAGKDAREDSKLAKANTSKAVYSPALIEAGYEYLIALSEELLGRDHKKDLQQLSKSLEALKRQKQDNLPLARVDIQIQQLINEIEQLRKREADLADEARQEKEKQDLKEEQDLTDRRRLTQKKKRRNLDTSRYTVRAPRIGPPSPGLLETGPSFSPQGPAATGTPGAPAGGSSGSGGSLRGSTFSR